MVLSLEYIEADSEVVGCEPTSKVILNQNDLGPGTLTIAHNSISWCSSNPEQHSIRGLNFTYTDIILFAVSKDAAVYKSECLFMLLDKQKNDVNQDSGIGDVINRLANGHIDDVENGNESGDDDENEDNEDDDDHDDEENSEELYIVLENVDKLKLVYDMLVQCQNLHPDPNQGDFDNWNDSDNGNGDDDDDDEFDSGYANNEGSNNNGIDEHMHENGNNGDYYEELVEDDDGMAADDEDDNDSLYEDAD